MDLFDKLAGIGDASRDLEERGIVPFGIRMERVVSPTEAVINGRDVVLAGTNNYLGLTFDPGCIEAAHAALDEEGTGTTGSRIANGTYDRHLALEREFADFYGRRSAIVFSTGYQANLGTIAGLAGPKDTIFIDADSHASIYDGTRLSGATVVRFRHNDAADLERRLARLDAADSNKLIVVEGIYSMLGDRAPLADFVAVKERHNAYLLVDEAHSMGVFGDEGRGVAEADGVEAGVDFVVGTFSKSLGAIGGFAVSDHPAFELLRYATRPYMFTASPSPSSMASVLAALRRIRTTPALRTRVWANARTFYDALVGLGYTLCAEASPIVAVKADDTEQAIAMWKGLLDAGVYVNLAIPPGTPNGLSLLRCSVSAAHTDAQLERIRAAFAEVAHALGIAPGARAARDPAVA